MGRNVPKQGLIRGFGEQRVRHDKEPPLVHIRTGDDVDSPARAGGDAFDGRCGQDVAVDHGMKRRQCRHRFRAPAFGIRVGDDLVLQRSLCDEESVVWHCCEGVTCGPHIQHLCEAARDLLRRCRRHDGMRSAALQNRAAEEAFGSRRRKQRADAHRAGGLAEDRDVVRIAAEGRDVVAHPGERCDLIEQPEIRLALAEIDKAIGADAVVDGDAHNPVAREAAAVITCARSDFEHAARYPNHDRQAGRAQGLGPDVEIEAVVADGGGVGNHRLDFRRRRHLQRLGAEGERVAHTAPSLDRLRRPKPVASDRRCRERHALEYVYAVDECAAQCAVARPDDRVHVRSFRRCDASIRAIVTRRLTQIISLSLQRSSLTHVNNASAAPG